MSSRDHAPSTSAATPKSAAPTAANPVIEELIGSLCGQVERAEDKAARWGQQLMAERKRANEAERRAVELVEALRPFAKIASTIHESWDGERRVATLSIDPLRVHHLRRALALVTVADAGASPSPRQVEGDSSRDAS